MYQNYSHDWKLYTSMKLCVFLFSGRYYVQFNSLDQTASLMVLCELRTMSLPISYHIFKYLPFTFINKVIWTHVIFDTAITTPSINQTLPLTLFTEIILKKKSTHRNNINLRMKQNPSSLPHCKSCQKQLFDIKETKTVQ